ncbi:hypothetical protein [Bradyrhizobium sp. Ec3.3]|uniref:hypothetical protein n=1 Tax=Bradyrhizobium sp. Ec3.3 TaxID=189753 RepID=UPI001FD9D652|nr:hypothetical protein [Bradyrhizobium sp. Ec3.3]
MSPEVPQQFVGEVLAICPASNVWQSRRIRIMGGVVAYPPKSFGNLRVNIDGAHARRRLNEKKEIPLRDIQSTIGPDYSLTRRCAIRELTFRVEKRSSLDNDNLESIAMEQRRLRICTSKFGICDAKD